MLIDGSDLLAMDEGGTSDPYCKFRYLYLYLYLNFNLYLYICTDYLCVFACVSVLVIFFSQREGKGFAVSGVWIRRKASMIMMLWFLASSAHNQAKPSQ